MAQLAALSPGLSLPSLHAELARLEQDAMRLAAAPALAEHGAAGQGFAHSLAQALHGVDAKDQAAGARIAAVESGESDDLVGAMLASQEASLSFSMLLQVRNKVVGAVDELIKMQL
jgi:flagellar hook-basal body complex protein FliE